MGYENWLWRLREDGKETGPFTYAELERRFAAQEINGDTQACPKKLLGGWARLGYFFPDFKANPPSATNANGFPELGNHSSEGARSFHTSDDSASPKLISCPVCKREISSLAVSCPQCGQPMNTRNIQVEQVKQTNMWLRVIILVLCLPLVIMSLKSCAANL
jgi:hypothetical protein